MPASIIDTHTHVVSPDTDRYPLQLAADVPHDWVGEHRLTSEQLLRHMDDAGVHGAVLVQARAAYGDDNTYVAAAREADPARLVSTAIVDMTTPDRGDALRRWAAQGVAGVRLFNIPPAKPSWLAGPELAAFVEAAAADGIRVSVCTLAPDIPDIARLLAAVPDVPIAVDHCAFADITADHAANDGNPLVQLADHANVRLKVTTTFLRPATDHGADARDVVGWLHSRFGADRLMWGSDFPQYHRESYPQIVAFGRHACSRLAEGEQALFLGGTANRLWPEL